MGVGTADQGEACCIFLDVEFSIWFHGVMVSTPDSESGNPSSNLGETLSFIFVFLLCGIILSSVETCVVNFKC